MKYELIWTPQFTRAWRSFGRAHPELRDRLARVLDDLEHDPRQERLRLHALHGVHAGNHAVRINFQYRITLTLRITEREVILLDIGTHDQVYRGGFE